MLMEELHPYLGKTCHLRLQCPACRRSHWLQGRLGQGRHHGDIEVEGQTFGAENVEAVWSASAPPPGRRLAGGHSRHLLRQLSRLRNPAGSA